MAIVYPTSLPEFVLEEGYSEKLNDQTIESQMESGSVKVRRRFTKQIRKFSIVLMLNESQLATFEDFWQNSLNGGSLPFDWLHPLTRQSLTLRFRNPAPSYTPAGGAYMRVSMVLETT